MFVKFWHFFLPFFSLLGEGNFNPSTYSSFYNKQLTLNHRFKSSIISSCGLFALIMPLTNGDVGNSSSRLTHGKETLDHTAALEILDKEYSNADGLDARTLLDSRINGGLTYNDFLVLPGYIGTLASNF